MKTATVGKERRKPPVGQFGGLSGRLDKIGLLVLDSYPDPSGVLARIEALVGPNRISRLEKERAAEGGSVVARDESPLQACLDQFGPESEPTIEVWRRRTPGSGGTFVCLGQFPILGFNREVVARRFGVGEYQIRARRSTGNYLKGGRRWIRIDSVEDEATG